MKTSLKVGNVVEYRNDIWVVSDVNASDIVLVSTTHENNVIKLATCGDSECVMCASQETIVKLTKTVKRYMNTLHMMKN